MKTTKHERSVLLFALALAGCAAALRDQSSGQIGCPSDEIVISNYSAGTLGAMPTWTATCHGRTYYCSSHGGGAQSTSQVACKEKASDVTVDQPAAGCQYDTQCKGDRICRAGQCVDKSSGAP
jgi:hypothetical protein